MSSAQQWLKARELHLVHWDVGGGLLWGEVRTKGKHYYTPWISTDGRAACGCPYSTYEPGRFCAHILCLILKVPRLALAQHMEMIITIDRRMVDPASESAWSERSGASSPGETRREVNHMEGDSGYITTSLTPLNELNGGVPYGSMQGIFGPNGTGKSIFTAQLAAETMRERKGDALFVDTEGGYPTLKEWGLILGKRFGLNLQVVPLVLSKDAKTGALTAVPGEAVDKKKRHWFVADIRDIETLAAFHGRGGTIDISEVKETKDKSKRGGKMSWKKLKETWISDVWETPMGMLCAKHQICFLAYDSLTNPLQVFGTNQENFPARADATNDLMLVAQWLTYKMGLVTVCVMHETVSAREAYARPVQTGGSAVGYNLKFRLYMEGPKKSTHTPKINDKKIDSSRGEDSRLLWIARHTSRKPWVFPAVIDLTNEGYVPAGEKAVPYTAEADDEPAADAPAAPEAS